MLAINQLPRAQSSTRESLGVLAQFVLHKNLCSHSPLSHKKCHSSICLNFTPKNIYYYIICRFHLDTFYPNSLKKQYYKLTFWWYTNCIRTQITRDPSRCKPSARSAFTLFACRISRTYSTNE